MLLQTQTVLIKIKFEKENFNNKTDRQTEPGSLVMLLSEPLLRPSHTVQKKAAANLNHYMSVSKAVCFS